MKKYRVQDNFLPEEDFNILRDIITSIEFPWFWTGENIRGWEKRNSPAPGQFIHLIYDEDSPVSQFYGPYFVPILDLLECEILSRIKLNLNHRLPEPFFSDFHIDPIPLIGENILAHLTTALFYINTNNGYTELEDGTKFENVANRLVVFPANKQHRGVTQTDTQTRILINFNYIKRKGNQ